MKSKISREDAELLADTILACEPRFRDGCIAKLIPLLKSMLQTRGMQEIEHNRFASPASPYWGMYNRETDTTKFGR
jgi:hypothetical protein